MNAPETRIEIPTVAGTPFADGFYAGRFFIGADAYALIVAPKAGEHEAIVWHDKRKAVAGATSYNDGLANTAAMAAAGSPLAQWAQNLRLGEHADWYVPSRLELLIAYSELTPLEAVQDDGVEGFIPGWYWSSTQYQDSASDAWYQYFGHGYQTSSHKSLQLRARAVRRLKI